ncbi:MAG: short-chain dehydrogenase/reductase [Rhodospirillales bacterium]|nr:short-chain dehydrogenase/reductase [Rhodospirillales bacterium]
MIVPGAFTKGSNYFANAGKPADTRRPEEYDKGPDAGLPEQSLKRLASLEPADADTVTVAEAILEVVDMPFGMRPIRTHIDPSEDGCGIVNRVADRVRAELFRRLDLEDLLSPRKVA